MRRPTTLFLLFICALIFGRTTEYKEPKESDFVKAKKLTLSLIARADSLFLVKDYTKAIDTYEIALSDELVETTSLLKKIAVSHAALNHASSATSFIEKYLKNEFNTSFLLDDSFNGIKETQEFKDLSDRYVPSMNFWSFLYLYVALIGFYIALVINFNNKIDRIARVLISFFLFIHSFFILNICFNITNYQFEYPHSYLMSTIFSFLYGPLLYFYFKRISQQYVFRKIDFLHLLPTLLLIIFMMPTYALSAQEKLDIMLDRIIGGDNPGDSKQMLIVVTLKLTSLIVYGYFIRKLYLKTKRNKEISTDNKQWQKNLYLLHILYVIAYAIYGLLIVNNLSFGIFYHTQIALMALMVLYIGYSANVQPNVFSGLYAFENRLFFKYEKSGLTASLSNELKEHLIRMFDEEKIYKENDISLESLAEKLNTTRHNASQVINEHFKVSFHELINTYRIREAKEILHNDLQKNLHIIDIAYEVGYNNKVTFNKAFKKITQLTPSEFQKLSLHPVHK